MGARKGAQKQIPTPNLCHNNKESCHDCAMVEINKYIQQKQGEINADKAYTAQFCEFKKSAVVLVAQDRQKPIMSNDMNISLSSNNSQT